MNLPKIARIASLALALASPSLLHADNLFVHGDAGIFTPSSTYLSSTYGAIMPKARLGVGLELDSGFRFGLDFSGSLGAQAGRFYDSSEIKILGVEGRATLVSENKEVIPYVGVQASFNMVQENIRGKIWGKEFEYDFLEYGGGFGAFAGIDVPISRKQTFYLEGLLEYISIMQEVVPNEPKIWLPASLDLSGVSVTAGIRHHF